MEYFWKENKRFVLAVAGAFVFLLLYNSFVLGPISKAASTAASNRANKKRELERRMEKGVPNDDGLVAGRRDAKQNKDLLGKMGPEVAFAIEDKFHKPKKKDIREYFDNFKLDLVEQLRKKAVEGRVALTSNLGLPEDVTDETSAEALARLAVVERLILLAVDSGVEKIEMVDAQHDRDDRNDRNAKKSQYLTKYSVVMKVVGKSESVFKLVHGAQKKGSFLAVTQFEMGRPDATKDLFEVSITAALLKVDDKAGLEAK
jgi:hypothetical protein